MLGTNSSYPSRPRFASLYRPDWLMIFEPGVLPIVAATANLAKATDQALPRVAFAKSTGLYRFNTFLHCRYLTVCSLVVT